MPYSAKAIANAFLDFPDASYRRLTPMKMQKLVYYAHGWNLALKDAPLIDEQVEAWEWGPVIPSLYHAFKHYGDIPIRQKVVDLRWDRQEDRTYEYEYDIENYQEDNDFTQSLLIKIWQVYGDYTPFQLSNMTHAHETPWYQVNELHKGRIPLGTDIPIDLIKKYFCELAESNLAEA